MTKKKQIKKCEVVTLTYKIDPNWKDPLLPINMDMFEEIEIEEIPSYYKIHLGVDIHKHEEV
jgi:hypothetical protein